MKPAFKQDLLFFPCFAGIFYSFGTPVGCLPIYRDLSNKTIKRIRKVFNRSIGLEVIMYIIITYSGYFSQTVNTPKIIIDRKSIFNNDIVMTLGKIGFFITITVAYIVNYICCKISIINIAFNNPEKFTNKINFIVTLIVVLLTTTIGCLYSNVVDYLSFLGGLLAVVLTYLIPTLLHIKVTSHHKYSYKVIIPLICTLLIVAIGWTGAIIVVLNIITGRSNNEG